MLSVSLGTQAGTQVSEDASDTINRVPVSNSTYITGGIIASTVGFGIGHAIHGRWYETGWVFTVAEGAGLLMLNAASSSCSKKADVNGVEKTECSNGGLAIIGLSVFVGFHVWEIVDAWTGAIPIDEGPKAFLIPNPQAPGFGIAWNF